MFVKRENDSNRKEWLDELFQEQNYRIVKRKESGDFEVYLGDELIITAEHEKDAREYIESAIGDS